MNTTHDSQEFVNEFEQIFFNHIKELSDEHKLKGYRHSDGKSTLALIYAKDIKNYNNKLARR